MSDSSLASRITSSTAAYVVAITAGSVAVWLTGVLSAALPLGEGNPLMALVLAATGWQAFAAVKLGAAAAIFALIAHLAPRLWTRRGAVWSFALLCVADAGWNLRLALRHPYHLDRATQPWRGPNWHTQAPPAFFEPFTYSLLALTAVALVAPLAIRLWRRGRWQGRIAARGAFVVLIACMLVLAPMAGPLSGVFHSPVRTVEAATDTGFGTFEQSLSNYWSTSGSTTWNISRTTNYATQGSYSVKLRAGDQSTGDSGDAKITSKNSSLGHTDGVKVTWDVHKGDNFGNYRYTVTLDDGTDTVTFNKYTNNITLKGSAVNNTESDVGALTFGATSTVAIEVGQSNAYLYLNGTQIAKAPLTSSFNTSEVQIVQNVHYYVSNTGTAAKYWVDNIRVGESSSTGKDLSGRVLTQGGAPIKNATVVAYGSKKPTVSKARDQLTDLADQTPQKVTDRIDNLQLMGSGGELQSLDAKYALAYSKSDIGTAPWADAANLKQPLIRNVPADQEIAFVVGDAGATENNIIEATQEYNRQLPGKASSGTVVVKRIGPNNDTVQTYTFKTDQTAGGGFGDPSSLKYATASLPTGLYRVSVKGSSFSYPIQVGSMREIMDKYLQNQQEALTNHAQQIRDAISGGSIVRKTTTTNASGYYSFDLPSGVKAVQVQALRAPAVSTSPSKLDLGDIRSEYNAQQPPEASIYLPSTPKRVEVPQSDVEIYMTELTWPPAANLTSLQDRLEELKERLRNEAQNVAQVIKTTGQQSLEELRTRYAELAGLIRANPALKDRYLALSNRSSVASASDLSRSELTTEIGHMNTALAQVASGGGVSGSAPDVSSSSVTKRWTVSGIDLSQANVSVIAHWSNGTTQPVAEQYIQINDDVVGDGGQVILESYPLGDKQPAAVSFSLLVSGQNGVARGSAQVKNPTFNGNLPTLASVEYSTLTPGPSDVVEMQLHPSKSSHFGQIKSVSVYAPDGSTVPANITADDTIRFETVSKGVHTVEATITNAGGTEFVETFRIKAAGQDVDRPPSIRTASSPVSGVYATVGDGFEGGDVEVKSNKVVITGQIGTSQEAPRRIHVYRDDLSASTDTPTEIQIVRGDSRQQVRQHLYVTVHAKSMPESGYVWRGNYDGFGGSDEQPVRGQYGTVDIQSNSTVVRTYTTTQGQVVVDASPSPGYGEQAKWLVDTQVPDVDIPGLVAMPAAPATATP